ncbi:WW domain-binding protein 1-like [Hyperolius riggenbachi]|uniref:WW domain-binding protein 1-like n=1 Tax=Hyperolius riggenbachi TaxID=752182 RepID=UPI0035A28204
MRREELAVRGAAYGRDLCFGEDRKPYRCEIGYCCGDTECCTYYYELWWFWLAWTLIILAGCCCAYRHRRVKLRHQQELRQREISLMAYQGVAPSATALEPWPTCKLPTYEEVTQDPPTPPPPYCEILEEILIDGEDHPLPAVISISLNLAPCEQEEEPLYQEGAPTAEHPQCQHDCTEQGSPSALERRRHITGDSGIVLCDEKALCLNREVEALGCGTCVAVETEEAARQGDN